MRYSEVMVQFFGFLGQCLCLQFIGDNRNDDAPAPRVLACCWGPGNPATTFVMLDSAGEVMNIMYTGYLTIRALSPEQIQRKQNDQARLLQFMRDYQPHVVVLGAANLNCRHLHHTIFEVCIVAYFRLA